MRYGFDSIRKHLFRNFFSLILAIMSISAAYFIICLVSPHKSTTKKTFINSSVNVIASMQTVVIRSNATMSAERNIRCNYYNCFNAYNCGKNGNQVLQVYVYPIKQYVNENSQLIVGKLSREFYSILKTVMESRYYTPNSEDACVYMPSLDTLSQENFEPNQMSQVLNSLP